MPKAKAKSARPTDCKIPTFIIPAIKIPQPDGGLLIKPGKPTEISELISTLEAAQILCISDRRVQYLCQIGNFKTACKPGGTVKSNWRVARHEIEERRAQRWDDAPARA